ncbi:MAG TPA: DUF2059 domain-containing protein [Thermoanaerobaculia bacterium]|nr:DUF2059 domain-containing protein [Thermoanaerobaculia bacterium]
MRRLILFAVIIAIAVPLFATEPNPSASQRALIEKLFKATNMDQMSNSIMDSMNAQIEKQFLQDAEAKGNDPEDIAEAKEMFALYRERSRSIDFGGLLHESYVRIYARYFTEGEIADLVAFYASPTGKKTLEVLPQLMSEGMKAGVENLTPKIKEVMAQVMEEQEKRRPWRRTMADMRALATAVEAYAADQQDGTYPEATDLGGLKTALKGISMAQKFPEKDMWGHPYEYVVSPDHHHYRIVSSGSDGIFEWDSRKIEVAKEGEPALRYRDRLEDDLIYADGSFVQLPLQAKPKAKKE